MKRRSAIKRKTKETNIEVFLGIEGTGKYSISTGIGFFDHMLELFAKHGNFDLVIKCNGDLNVDDHHSVEDIAIALGKAFHESLGTRAGIMRYGYVYVPMDETLARCVIDLSGRSTLIFGAEFKRKKIGNFSTEMVHHFFQSFADSVRANVHLEVLYGSNTHHKIEALFKAFAIALRLACARGSVRGIPSTKGKL